MVVKYAGPDTILTAVYLPTPHLHFLCLFVFSFAFFFYSASVLPHESSSKRPDQFLSASPQLTVPPAQSAHDISSQEAAKLLETNLEKSIRYMQQAAERCVCICEYGVWWRICLSHQQVD